MKKMFVMVVLLGMVFTGYAADVKVSDNTALVKELMKVTKVEEQMQRSMQMVKQMQKNMISKMTKNIADREAAIRVQQKSFDLVMKELSWEKLQGEFIKVYAEVFTAKELQGMVTFYRSELGRTIINKMPLLQQKLMPVMQQKMMKIIPKLKKAVEKLVAEEKAKADARKKAAAKQQVPVKSDQKSNPKPDQKTGATPKK
jgi:uncharacterized protein